MPARQARKAAPGPWAWAVAAAPLAALGIAIVGALAISPDSGVSGPVAAGWIGGAVLAFIAAEMDSKSLKKAGDSRLSGWGPICVVLSGWAYLLVRAIRRRTGAAWGAFAACAAVTVLVIAVIAPLATAVKTSNATFNQAGVQSEIASWIKQKSGYAVKVSCPHNPPFSAGTKFTCIATADDGSTVPVDVTVQDSSGDIVWQVGGS